MKKLTFLIIFLFFYQICYATTYYVREDGTAAIGSTTGCGSAGTAANIAAYDAATYIPGDTICLCREGGIFTSQLRWQSDGGVGTEITYDGDCDGDGLKASFVVPNNHAIYTNRYDNGTIKNIDFPTIEDGKAGIFIRDGSDNVEITGIDCSYTTASRATFCINAYLANNADGDSTDIRIHHNNITGNSKFEGIRFGFFATTYLHTFGNVSIHDNTITNVRQGIRFFLAPTSTTFALTNDLRPYNIKINDNTITNTHSVAIDIATGAKESGGSSWINSNLITDCGDSTEALVNCFQLHWIDGFDILNNTIDGVNTSECDGAAIILDYKVTDHTYKSTNNILAYNTIKNTNASCGGKGIGVWSGANNIIQYNVISGATLAGIRLANAESTGNSFYNNTVYGTTNCFYLSGSAPTSIWKNNICSTVTGKGFLVNGGAADPTESNNLIFNANGGNDITLDRTDVTSDPTFENVGSNNFDLLTGSHAIGAGIDLCSTLTDATDISGNAVCSNGSYTGNKNNPDIGAYEAQTTEYYENNKYSLLPIPGIRSISIR